MLRCDPEHFGDHDHRQRLGEVAHEIEGSARRQHRERLVDDGRDACAQFLDALGRERFGGQIAQARVRGRFHRHEMARLERVERGIAWIGRRPAEILARADMQDRTSETARAQNRGDVFITAEEDLVQARLVEYRRLFAQRRQPRIRIANEGRVVHLERAYRQRARCRTVRRTVHRSEVGTHREGPLRDAARDSASADRQQGDVVADRRRPDFAQYPLAQCVGAGRCSTGAVSQPREGAVERFEPALDEAIGIQQQHVAGREQK